MTELTNEHFEIIDKNKDKEFLMKKKDRDRFDKLKQIGCIACLKIGKVSEAVIHHIRKKTGLSIRPPNSETIPLCPEHHNMGNKSVHLNKKLFVSIFGTENELLTLTNLKLEELERSKLFYGEKNK